MSERLDYNCPLILIRKPDGRMTFMSTESTYRDGYTQRVLDVSSYIQSRELRPGDNIENTLSSPIKGKLSAHEKPIVNIVWYL